MAVDEQTSDRKTLMKQVEKAKARLAEIDIIISNIYEGKALGRITEHRCLAMTEKYDTESKKTAKRDLGNRKSFLCRGYAADQHRNVY